jgi:CRP-like cAMP-binding protein
MYLIMFSSLINIIKQDTKDRERFRNSFIEREIPAKTVIVREGTVSTHVYIIKKGCLRQWFNKDGKDITFQFFFEGQPVACIESFLSREPSLFTLESIESSIVISISKDDFDDLNRLFPQMKDEFHDYLYQRFRNYAKLFLSRIKDTPRERYADLIKTNPEIVQRIPQHYIASYLGISPVSLSRIRNRK